MLYLDMGLFSSDNTRHVRRLRKIADRVMLLEETFQNKTDAELRACTDEFKARLKNGETVDKILPEAFACVREAAWRVLNQKPYYVQVLGGVALHQGRIAEMKTGEGKTLTSIFPCYLNALQEKGVHATFFVTRTYIRDNPELVKRMVNEGHIVGNGAL